MIVVSNTSPLTNLAAIGQFHLLQQLYQDLHIAGGVWQELNAYQPPPPGSKTVATAPWVYCHTVSNHSLVMTLRQDLDKGEAETLALAVELLELSLRRPHEYPICYRPHWTADQCDYALGMVPTNHPRVNFLSRRNLLTIP